jgi:hypothetical protein
LTFKCLVTTLEGLVILPAYKGKLIMTFDYNKYFPTEGEFSRAEIERIITLHDMPITDDLLKLARACFAEAKIKGENQA